MKLKNVSLISTILGMALALMVGGSLIWITTEQHEKALHVKDAVESVDVSQSLKFALLEYGRVYTLNQNSPIVNEELSAIRSRVESLLDRGEKVEFSPTDKALIRNVRKDIKDYFQLKPQDLPSNPVRRMQAMSRPLYRTLETLEKLSESDRNKARVAISQSDKLDTFAKTVGLLTIGLAVLTILLCNLIFKWWVLDPLLSLTNALVVFSHGDKSARARGSPLIDVTEAASSFNEMCEKLIRQEKIKYEYLLGFVHDLRNPLTAMKLAISAFLTGKVPPDDKKGRDLFGLVSQQIKAMERLIMDCLDVQRIENGVIELKLEVVDLRDIAREAFDAWNPSQKPITS